MGNWHCVYFVDLVSQSNLIFSGLNEKRKFKRKWENHRGGERMQQIKIEKMNDRILAAAIYLFIPYKLYRKREKKKRNAPRKKTHTQKKPFQRQF